VGVGVGFGLLVVLFVVVLLVVLLVVVEVVPRVVVLVEPVSVVVPVPSVPDVEVWALSKALETGTPFLVVLSLRSPAVQSVAKPRTKISSTIITPAVPTAHFSRLSCRLYLSNRFNLLLSSC